MKICAIICEYNPFHNGHLYQMQEARRLSGADAVLCLMSGNFVQRGEDAILDKYVRAKHAVMAGADAVIELPTLFATSNAELFAKGAIHLLSAIPAVTTLCFGAENADKHAFLRAAGLFNNEPKEISKEIKELSASGLSYAKTRAIAWGKYIPESLLSSPNNILGLEYTRAILAKNAKIDILPIKRIGAGYNDVGLHEEYSSASGIRKAMQTGTDFSNKLPSFVTDDLPNYATNCLDSLEKYAILCHSAEEIKKICDCTEGLENAFKKASALSSPLVETLTSPRYTSSRIRRIALQNLLGIDEMLIRNSLKEDLYLRVLAIKKEDKELLSVLSNANVPLLIRAHDEEKLFGVAKRCFDKDIFAEKIYALLSSPRKISNIFI